MEGALDAGFEAGAEVGAASGGLGVFPAHLQRALRDAPFSDLTYPDWEYPGLLVKGS